MSDNRMHARAMYLQIKTHDGKTHVEMRQIWDAAKFTGALEDEYKKVAEKEGRAPDTFRVISRETYEAIKFGKGKK